MIPNTSNNSSYLSRVSSYQNQQQQQQQQQLNQNQNQQSYYQQQQQQQQQFQYQTSPRNQFGQQYYQPSSSSNSFIYQQHQQQQQHQQMLPEAYDGIGPFRLGPPTVFLPTPVKERSNNSTYDLRLQEMNQRNTPKYLKDCIGLVEIKDDESSIEFSRIAINNNNNVGSSNNNRLQLTRTAVTPFLCDASVGELFLRYYAAELKGVESGKLAFAVIAPATTSIAKLWNAVLTRLYCEADSNNLLPKSYNSILTSMKKSLLFAKITKDTINSIDAAKIDISQFLQPIHTIIDNNNNNNNSNNSNNSNNNNKTTTNVLIVSKEVCNQFVNGIRNDDEITFVKHQPFPTTAKASIATATSDSTNSTASVRATREILMIVTSKPLYLCRNSQLKQLMVKAFSSASAYQHCGLTKNIIVNLYLTTSSLPQYNKIVQAVQQMIS